MKSRILSLLIAAGLPAAGASSCFAWGQTGHRVTAEIAERNLTPKARAAIESITGGESLVELSTWPDDIRSDGAWDFVQPWHCISIDDDEELSLHRVWDESLIESTKLSYTEFATFLNRVPGEVRKKWSRASHLDIARESKAIRSQVYDFGAQRGSYYLNIETAPVLSYDYRHKNLPLVRERLAQAGIRLASKLNAFFAAYPH